METQFQTNSKLLESKITSNVVRKAQNLVNSNLTTISTSSPTTIISNSTVQLNATNRLTGGAGKEQQTSSQKLPQNVINNTNNNSTTTNLITSNGQAPQPLIQVSSQTIVPGSQLMVQTISNLPARSIQLRTNQAFPQIQLIPFNNLNNLNSLNNLQAGSGGTPNQRPVIIQPPANVQLHSATAITSISNLATHNNVGKITSIGGSTNNSTALSNSINVTHQKPVIIQSASGQFLHSTNVAQGHTSNLHNVNKGSGHKAIVGRATARPTTNQQTGKMVLGHLATNHHSTASTTGSTVMTCNHATLQQNHLTNNSINNAQQQVARLNIISSLPSTVHTSVSSNIQHANTAGKPILSLATATLNKPLILNPATNVVQPSIMGNVVNMSSFNAANTHQLKQQKNSTNLLPTVMTLTTLTTSSGSLPGRHTMITSNTANLNSNSQPQFQTSSTIQPQRLTVPSSNTSSSLNTTGQLINNSSINSTNNNNSNLIQTQQILSQPQSSTAVRSNLQHSSNALNSPIKQQISQNTQSSPRPSILIRKRVGTNLDNMDSKLNYQSSINSNSANNSQLNSVKQNLSLKYNSSTASSNNTNQAVSTIKNAQDLLNKKPTTTMVNNFKKQNLDSGQLIKNENELSDNDCNQQQPTNNNITPRKRRKQLLEPFMLTTSQNIKLLNDDSSVNLLCNEDMVRKKDYLLNYQSTPNNNNNSSTIGRRPRPSLLSSYNITWKSLQYHFLKHAEVKIKNEKKANLADLTNETLKKRNGWKVNHLSVQLDDILQSEISFNQKLKELAKLYSENKDLLPPKVKELGNKPFNAKVCHNSISVLDKLNDLFAANIQRSNLFHDQIKDMNSLLNKLSNDHKEKVGKITKRFLNTSKRNATVKV